MENGILIGCHHGLKSNELKYMCKTFEKYFNSLKNFPFLFRIPLQKM